MKTEEETRTNVVFVRTEGAIPLQIVHTKYLIQLNN